MFSNAKGLGLKMRYLWEMAFPKREILKQISGYSNPLTFWISYPYRVTQLATLGLAQLAITLMQDVRKKTD